jgi:hypothetical protein
VTHADRPLLLRQEGNPVGERGERRPGGRHDPQELERGDDPVPRRCVLANDDVTALLAAQAGAGDEHGGQDVLVADRRPHDAAAGRLDRVLEAPVGENRDDQAPLGEIPASQPLQRQDPEHLIAVDEAALGVHGNAAISVTVECEPDVGPAGPDERGERRRVGRPAVAVDVVAVGSVMEDGDPGPGRGEDRRSDAVGRAVGDVDDDVETRRVSRAGQLSPVIHVPPEQVAGVERPAEPVRRGSRQLVGAPDQRLELILERVVELQPVPVEHLETVVLGRIVRGRDHDPRLERALGGQEGERRGRDHPHLVDVDAKAGGARRDRGNEHVPGTARVLADHDGARRADDAVRRGAAQGDRERGAQVDVGDAPDPVRAK